MSRTGSSTPSSTALSTPRSNLDRASRIGARLLWRWESIAVWLELVQNLAVRDVEVRYKHSLLGLYWAVINPLINAAIFSFVFGLIFHASGAGVPYPVFLITGLTFWNLFANGVSSAAVSITGSAALLTKVYFPRVVLPTAAVLARAIDFGFSLVVLAVFLAVFRVPIRWTAVGILAILVLQGMFTLGIAYIVASLNVLYRDVSQLTGLVLTVWMYLSPVMYPVERVPVSIRSALLLNPMGAILQAERDLLFLGHLTNLPYLCAAVAWAVLTFLGGLAVFHRIEPVFVEVL